MEPKDNAYQAARYLRLARELYTRAIHGAYEDDINDRPQRVSIHTLKRWQTVRHEIASVYLDAAKDERTPEAKP